MLLKRANCENSVLSEHFSSAYGYKWDVPLTYVTSEDPNNRTLVWMSRDQERIKVSPPTGSKWTKFNVGQRGYYRVNYPLEDWENFGQILLDRPEVLSSSDRTSLLNDAFSLAQADRIPYSTALSLTKFLSNETRSEPLTQFFSVC